MTFGSCYYNDISNRRGSGMKRIIKFIIYKVLEIGGAFAVWYGASWLGFLVANLLGNTSRDPSNMYEVWIMAPFVGILSLIVLIVVPIMICSGLYEWIKWNWKKAGE